MTRKDYILLADALKESHQTALLSAMITTQHEIDIVNQASAQLRRLTTLVLQLQAELLTQKAINRRLRDQIAGAEGWLEGGEL